METWVPVCGFEAYYVVSDLGNFRRTQKGATRSFIDKNIKTYRNKNGYTHVWLSEPFEPETRKQFRACRIILLSFLGAPPSPQHQANHKNGIKDDDRLSNLEWVTPQQNCRHAYDELGRTKPLGSKHHNSKLTEKRVREARRLIAQGVSQESIAARYGVSGTCLSNAVRGLTWGHVV